MRRSIAAVVFVALFATGCGNSLNAMDPAQSLGINPVIGLPVPIPGGQDATPLPSAGPLPPIGSSCQGGGSQHICLALKYVAYVAPGGGPVIDESQAIANVQAMNDLWRQCDVGFQMEQYVAASPASHQLNFETSSYQELDQVRRAFVDGSELVVVTTGTWNRSGSLGTSAANAWTAMPGGGPYGTVMEEPVGGFANIIAHELGHYLGLPHVSDVTDLMNPVIYSNSMQLTSEQCALGRSAAAFFWKRMYR